MKKENKRTFDYFFDLLERYDNDEIDKQQFINLFENQLKNK